MREDLAVLVADVKAFAAKANSLQSLQEFVVKVIPERLAYYNWTGFYMLDPDDEQMLVLGPYVGAVTEHTRIPVSEGICGAAVVQDETVIIDDVNSDPRYLACSLETKSEIVVPIRVHGKVVGEIDIDSHDLAAFTGEDKVFLEQLAEVLGEFMGRAS